MSIFDRFWGKPNKKETPVSEYKTEKPKLPANTITGDDVTYIVPKEMSGLRVEIYDKNGKFIDYYTLTRYVSIKSGDRIRLKVLK